ncbi:MAG: phage tail sheath subtilisin-like domain-containing protein [Eubacterium sp.]
MSGTWENQNKVLPGAYINIRTNEPLSINLGDRGTVALLQEMSVGTDAKIYTITATSADWPDKATAADKFMAGEALKKAKTVLVYKLPKAHTAENVTTALAALKTVDFNVLCYPYDGASEVANQTAITAWIKAMRNDEGVKCQAVLANQVADSEGIINVGNGVVMADGTAITAAQTTAWVAGATAGASITTSNTCAVYVGAIDVSPRMTKTEMEAAITAGKFIFKVDSAQNVMAVYDINSLTSVTVDKGKAFTKNRLIRTLDNIANDVTKIFESSYVGKLNNNESGRSLLKASLVEYFVTLQGMGAIQNFETDDVVISAGVASDAVVIAVNVQPVDSVEKIYITVNCS